MSATEVLVFPTARMVLRVPRECDAAEYFARITSAEEVTRYVSWPRHRSVNDTLAFIRYGAAAWEKDRMGPLLMFDADSRRLLGTTGLSFLGDGVALTGYVLARDVWGQGLATEALAEMVRLAQRLRLTMLVAGVRAGHAQSIGVLRKCGFVQQGERSDYVFPNLPPGEEGIRLDFVRPINPSLR